MLRSNRARIALAVFAAALVVLLAWGELKVKKAASQDPEFCLACHQMDGPYERWEQSARG